MAAKEAYRSQVLNIPENASNDELRGVLANLVESGAVSADKVHGALDQIRAATGESAKAASAVTRGPEIIISSPEKKLLTKLEEDYEKQTEDLRITGQANEGMFSRIQIIEALRPDVLARALRIYKLGKGATPKGLLVSDHDRHAKVKAIDSNNSNKVKGQRHDTEFYDADNKDLWNGGQEWPWQGQWQYEIVQGEQEVTDDSNIRGINYERATLWAIKIMKAGLDVLTGADPYLALMRQSLVEGKPIDLNTLTVLNGQYLARSSLVACGHRNYGHVSLNGVFPAYSNQNLRARALMWVNVPKA